MTDYIKERIDEIESKIAILDDKATSTNSEIERNQIGSSILEIEIELNSLREALLLAETFPRKIEVIKNKIGKI